MMGMEVFGKTLGIIGFGAIGRRVAKIAHFGLGMKVLAADVLEISEGEIEKLKKNFGIDTYTNDVDVVLTRADIIGVHLPSIPETRHFFNADRLAAMKPGSMLINTSRGPVVDEKELINALNKGHISGAGLDVYEKEPAIPPALREMKNVTLLPHIGSADYETREKMMQLAAEGLWEYLNGGNPKNRVI